MTGTTPMHNCLSNRPQRNLEVSQMMEESFSQADYTPVMVFCLADVFLRRGRRAKTEESSNHFAHHALLMQNQDNKYSAFLMQYDC